MYKCSIKLSFSRIGQDKSKLQKQDRNKLVKKRTLFNKTRQYNIQMFDKIIFFKYKTRQIKPIETNM